MFSKWDIPWLNVARYVAIDAITILVGISLFFSGLNISFILILFVHFCIYMYVAEFYIRLKTYLIIKDEICLKVMIDIFYLREPINKFMNQFNCFITIWHSEIKLCMAIDQPFSNQFRIIRRR